MVSFDGESVKEVPYIFALVVTICEKLTFQFFNLTKLGQGRGVQLSQWCRRSQILKMYKNRPMHVCASSHRFSDINF